MQHKKKCRLKWKVEKCHAHPHLNGRQLLFCLVIIVVTFVFFYFSFFVRTIAAENNAMRNCKSWKFKMGQNEMEIIWSFILAVKLVGKIICRSINDWWDRIAATYCLIDGILIGERERERVHAQFLPSPVCCSYANSSIEF